MDCIDTNTLISICTCAIGATQFLLWKHISRQKAYVEEKGKNLATKEDIGSITKKIESVKESYNKALENHKIELQKEFEFHKYIQTLCWELDKKLLTLVSACLNANVPTIIDEWMYDDKLVSNTCELSNFLNTYKSRYESCQILKELTKISSKIKFQEIAGNLCEFNRITGDLSYKLKNEDKELLINLLNQTLLLFIPELNINNK